MLVKFNHRLKKWIEIPKEKKDSDCIYLDGLLKKKLDNVKMILAKDWDCFFIIDGIEGCLSGDTEIQINRFKLSRRYTIKKLYNHYHNNPDKVNTKMFDLSEPSFVRSYNGKEIRLHKIKDVMYSGKKMTYLITLDNGQSIKATSNHKFITRDGWKELSKLKSNEEIMCDNLHTKKNGRKKIKLYDIQLRVPFHPHPTNNDRVEVHRLIYEARLNNLTFLEFLDILLNEPEKSKQLKFISTDFHIHHKDGCHYNNSIDNLELISREEHLKYHGLTNYTNFSQGSPIFVKIKSIEEQKVEDVYDIECEEPHHNFVANGIVVSNSGKSTLGLTCAWYLSDTNFTTQNICKSSKEAIEKMSSFPKNSVLIIDEGDLMFSSKDVFNQEQKLLINLTKIIRFRKLVLIIIAPSFFDLNRGISERRSKFLLHIYTDKKLTRGRFAYFGSRKKHLLFNIGKKNYNSYDKPRADFVGTFTDFKMLNYIETKDETVNLLVQTNEESRFKIQRDYLLNYIKKKYKLTFEELVNVMNECQYPLKTRQISKEISKIRRFGTNL